MRWLSRLTKASVGEIPAGGGNDLESRTQQIGLQLLAATRHGAAGALSKKFWSDRLMGWALQNESFKVQLFRFIDVFPVLKTPEAIHQHLVEYLDAEGVTLPKGLALGLKAGGLLKGTLAGTIASQIEGMAANFIAGHDVVSVLPALEKRWREGIAYSVDLLGETCVSEAEAVVYRERYLDLIEGLPEASAAWPARAALESDHLGPIPRCNVSIKISALDGHVAAINTEAVITRLADALAPLLKRAAAKNVLINFDMEHHGLKDLTIGLFKRCCEQIDFPAGLAMQAYLQSADADARDLIEWSRKTKRVVTVRLIKGAYWDYETIHSEMMGWRAPVWPTKPQTDACFERLTELFIRQTPRRAGEGGIKLALGTHNIRSVARGIAALEAADLPKSAIEFQALRGMGDEMKLALAAEGWRVREYVPVGEMIPGMAYLVRRLLENTSNEGWLRAGSSDSVSDAALLASPHDAASEYREREDASAETHDLSAAYPDVGGGRKFFSESPRDFSSEPARDHFRAAISSDLPARPSDVTLDQAYASLGVATDAFPAWRERSQQERSTILLRAAADMRSRRDAIAGVLIREAGKTWAEADGDVCEAIDFCEYYARMAMDLAIPHRLGKFVGELNEELHTPRGVAVVISPWNFPLAICCGMTVAALVTGNAVCLKPAEQTPIVARILCEALWSAGVPRAVLHFLPGPGEIIGAALVRDARVSVIAFTGSKGVGLDILRAAAETPAGQDWVKRVVCEMGGKNAIIVDDSADLDEAVLGVRQSAFGFAGQKCSAGSRVIVTDAVHDQFVARLVEATRLLAVGDPLLPGTDIGPVIDGEAFAKIRRYIDVGNAEARCAFASTVTGEVRGKPLAGPHIFTGVLPAHSIARDEIFGPVLAVLRAKDFNEALRLANESAYKLTGGVFSRTPSHLESARRDFRVGNLYINRGITGALVGRQPFGGFGLSGVGSKAGGRHYLLQFTDPRIITENTLRRGFAPTESVLQK